MAITYSIAPNPHWVIIDNFSRLPNGAAIYTYSNLNPSQFKPAYVDASGTIPYGQPITGFGNGTMPAIFWKFDSDNPDDTYYIRVYDSANPSTQVFLWDFAGLSGIGGGGGGGTVVTAFDIENLVVNNVFFRNTGNQTGTPSLPATFTVCPSTHQGFVNDASNANVTTNGPVGPDTIFAKNNTSASDDIQFIDFTPLGTHILSTTDLTPELYLQYNCTGAGSGETYKYIQFPISQGVQNLSEQPVVIKFYGRCNSGNNTVQLSWRQYFGSGGSPSADQIVAAGAPIALPSIGFSTTVLMSTVPSVVGKTLGTCGNDGLFLQVGFPLNDTTSIDFVKTDLYLGTIVPTIEYDTHDQIDSLVNTPRTGDVRISLNSFMPGWVLMNDGTIGNGSSNATTRANQDTYPLFSLIWNLFSGSQSLAPMLTSGGVPIAYGADATADFTANRQLTLTAAAGRVMAGVSGAHLIGTVTGSETHTMTISELVTHSHNAGAPGTAFMCGFPPGTGTFNAIAGNNNGFVSTTATEGSSTPFSIVQPTVFMTLWIKL